MSKILHISEEAKQAIFDQKRLGETYSEVILRLVNFYIKNKVEPKPDIFKDF